MTGFQLVTLEARQNFFIATGETAGPRAVAYVDMLKLNFSAKKEERLIEIVRKNYELFDLLNQKYKDAMHKGNI